ncbi:thiol-disulfide oxidoreductase [Pukyongia salina]|uniref:Thiol-disulfide oxidoreductase n=1 Tax=Pukyongia salina TaxID=2094025 RepID=A0A2S0HZ87_9FLAO|nr:TlpA disulfide reductase family protein [Pukyongia salina]AVI51493.1 thiol-disulfide oxidoreductase [Pukyongia salina]
MKFIRKHLFTLLFLTIFGLLLYPPTGVPIKAFVQRLLMISPGVLDESERVMLSDYNWTLSEVDGGTKNFSDSHNKVCIVNLWATWCPPCVAELPSMQRLYNRYGDRVDFYFVSAEDPGTVQRFLQKKNYELPVYIEVERPPAEMQVTTIPTTFLIDKNGRILIQKTGAAKWDSEKVRALLDSLLQ